jgi:hypothetical protein
MRSFLHVLNRQERWRSFDQLKDQDRPGATKRNFQERRDPASRNVRDRQAKNSLKTLAAAIRATGS